MCVKTKPPLTNDAKVNSRKFHDTPALNLILFCLKCEFFRSTIVKLKPCICTLRGNSYLATRAVPPETRFLRVASSI